MSGGIAHIEDNTITLLATGGNKDVEKTEQELQEDKKKLEEEITLLREEGSLDQIEEALIQMDAIKADIALTQVK